MADDNGSSVAIIAIIVIAMLVAGAAFLYFQGDLPDGRLLLKGKTQAAAGTGAYTQDAGTNAGESAAAEFQGDKHDSETQNTKQIQSQVQPPVENPSAPQAQP